MIEKDLILDYDIIRGMPGEVAEQVRWLLREQSGWQPFGKPEIIKVEGTEIIAQCMVRYNENNND